MISDQCSMRHCSDRMIDSNRVKRRLLDLERYSERLKGITLKSQVDYKKSDSIVKAATERNLQLISDMELEVMMLLYKGLDLSLAGDDISLIDMLSGKISAAALSKTKERRILRNLLVHAYSDSSYDERVFQQASDLSDVKDFIKDVKKLLG